MNAPYLPEILVISALVVLVGVPFLLYVRSHLSRLQKLAMQKTRAKVERLRREEKTGVPPNPEDYHYAISFDSKMLTVTDLRGQKHRAQVISWSAIRQAMVFKRDLFSMDCICLRISCADGTGVELNEEMTGWNRLIDALPTYLSSCLPHSEWYSAVAFPAFAPNSVEIYVRATTQNTR